MRSKSFYAIRFIYCKLEFFCGGFGFENATISIFDQNGLCGFQMWFSLKKTSEIDLPKKTNSPIEIACNTIGYLFLALWRFSIEIWFIHAFELHMYTPKYSKNFLAHIFHRKSQRISQYYWECCYFHWFFILFFQKSNPIKSTCS